MTRNEYAGPIAVAIVLVACLLLWAGVPQRLFDGAGGFLMSFMDRWVRHE